MLSQKFLVLSLLLLLEIPSVHPGAWSWLNFDGGGWFTGLAIHPSGRLYGRTDVGGAYRSDDVGKSWQWLSFVFPYPSQWNTQGIAIDPRNPDVLYLALSDQLNPVDPGQGLWRSEDGGKTFSRLLDTSYAGNDQLRLGSECIAIDPSDPDKVWTGSRNGVYYSSDYGKSWTHYPFTVINASATASISLHQKFPGQVWVGGYGGLWISLNYGNTWSHVFTSDYVLTIVRKSDGTVFFISHTGSTDHFYVVQASDWTNLNTYKFTDMTSRFDSQGSWSGFTMLSMLNDESIVLGYADGSMGRSLDNGNTWKLFKLNVQGFQPIWRNPSENSPPFGRGDLRQDPTNINRWIMGTGYGPMETYDQGNTWDFITNGIGEVVMFGIDFHPTKDVIFFGCEDIIGFFKTPQEQYSLRSRLSLLPNNSFALELRYGHRAMFWGDTFIVASNNLYGEGFLAISNDGGSTWWEISQDSLVGIKGYSFIDAVGSLNDPNDYIVQVMGGLFRTRDGTHFYPTNGTWAYFWGNTWWQLHTLTRDATLANVRYTILWGSGFWRSDDGGDNWYRPTDPINKFPTQYGVLASDQARSKNLWAVIWTVKDSKNALWRSVDGGLTWSPVGSFSVTDLSGNNQLNGEIHPSVDAYDGQVVVCAKGPGDIGFGVWFSPDEGATWKSLTSNTFYLAAVQSVSIDPRNRGKVYVALNGRSVAVWTP